MPKFEETNVAMTRQFIPAIPVRQRIVDILQHHDKQTGQEAVEYVLNLFEARKPDEKNRKEVRAKTNTVIEVEIDPYADRIEYCLRKYFKLPPGHQKLVRDARAEEVFWRGDDIEGFRQIWEETERMRAIGVVDYRQEALEKMKKLFGGAA